MPDNDPACQQHLQARFAGPAAAPRGPARIRPGSIDDVPRSDMRRALLRVVCAGRVYARSRVMTSSPLREGAAEPAAARRCCSPMAPSPRRESSRAATVHPQRLRRHRNRHRRPVPRRRAGRSRRARRAGRHQGDEGGGDDDRVGVIRPITASMTVGWSASGAARRHLGAGTKRNYGQAAAEMNVPALRARPGRRTSAAEPSDHI